MHGIKIAIVIPVFKQPGLLTEAITSALAQQVNVPYAIVIVNDGCPYAETHRVALEFVQAMPEKFLYIHRANGGLSTARNTGIQMALDAFPDLEAIYFLDADNRLHPHALQRAYHALKTSPEEVGWAYPDIDKFGFDVFCNTAGEYSALAHLAQNFCDAGSMVRRSVFERGIRFDEQMRMGYEDWEFWLQCMEAGFCGIHVPDMGFQYRQRAESMLKESERHHKEIIHYIVKKHKSIFSVRHFLRAEHEQAPRYAIYVAESDAFILATDPTRREHCITYRAFEKRYLSQRQRPEIGKCPEYLVFTSEVFLKQMEREGILPWLLWKMQLMLKSQHFCAVTIEAKNGEHRIAIHETRDWPASAHTIPWIMCHSHLMEECLRDPKHSWIGSLATPEPQPLVGVLEYQPHVALEASYTPAITSLFSVFSRLQQRHRKLPSFARPEVEYALSHKWDAKTYSNDIVGLEITLPLASEMEERHVGMLMSICRWGGVERVTFNYAQALKAWGYVPHLFIAGQQQADIPPYFSDLFRSINFFTDPMLGQYPSLKQGREYMGTPMTRWPKEGNHDLAVSLLAGMNVVINCHCYELNAAMASLRRLGIRTYSSQHLVDLALPGYPQGVPHELLAYEHAYDGVIVISQQLRKWFLAQGVPDEKIVHIPNAASYPLEDDTIEEILLQKAHRPNDSPLRMLYIGRFDRQKGLDRLAALIQMAASRDMPVEWRVVGGSILQDDTSEAMQILAPWVHPPALSAEELNAHYGWADMLVLLSRYEGVPLTLLEAGRLGCVALATDVGAVNEAIDDGRTGFLFNSDVPMPVLTARLCDVMAELWSHRPLLKRMAAFASINHRRQWDVAPLIHHINGDSAFVSATADIHRHQSVTVAA